MYILIQQTLHNGAKLRIWKTVFRKQLSQFFDTYRWSYLWSFSACGFMQHLPSGATFEHTCLSE